MNKAVFTLLVASIVVPNALSQSTSSTTKEVTGSKSTRTTAKQQSAKPAPSESPSAPVETEKAPQPTETKTDATTKTEATPKAADKAATTPSDETKAAPTDEKIAEPEIPADPIDELRGKIESATDVEKLRLQLKLADQLAAAGRQPEAMTELIHAAATDIFDPTSFYNIGNSFARLGAPDAAINAYRKAIDQRKGNYSRAFNNMGVILLRSGRWEEAQQAFLSALKIESFRYAEASYNLGRLYAAQGQNDLATREWRRALSVDPRHSAAAEALTRNSSGETIVVEPRTTSDPKPKSISSL